ncbi:helix-turn-helix domain-containing protein [Cellulomonas soli]
MDSAGLAAVLGIPRSTVERMAAAGQVPHLRVGKHIRFTPGHLGEIITDAERRPRAGVHSQSRGSARTRL